MTVQTSTLCLVCSEIPGSDAGRFKLRVFTDYTVAQLYSEVSTQLGNFDIQLLLSSNSYSQNGLAESRLMKLENSSEKTLHDVGFKFADDYINQIIVRRLEPATPRKSCDSPFNGSSAYTPPTPPSPPPPPPPPSFDLTTKLPQKSVDTNKEYMIGLLLDSDQTEDRTVTSADKSKSLLAIMSSETQSFTTAPDKGRSVSTATGMDVDVDLDQYRIKSALKLHTPSRTNHGYVGLVNQAMTCYLNSLLQALFMTPEFRNAMYKWEYVGDDETKSIPYQLQKLFLNMQTSTKTAVETTDLTKSFGWDSSEAWQQHDIQELCRVMFDALEQKFKCTNQADLINQLYQGKMIDYVKCLDCNTEKSREDAFLDIPLPVKPFGSTVAYESIEQALQAFVEPERLDGNNQYFCEKCDRKCDAHKGLKFTRFPYVLTLHLKRFDFDYQTFHRIKLNDKVTFPQMLNLNSFVKEECGSKVFCSAGNLQPRTSVTSVTGNGPTGGASNTGGSGSSEHGSVESAIKCDDCSTTDSESALDEESSANLNNNNTINNNNNNNNNTSDPDLMMQEDDEGIDVTSTADTKSTVSVVSSSESGPYIYELFAIMIHSGSASGGHYYAYIKEFETGEWFCFNDQSVTLATQEDINKSFGGTRSYSGGSGFSTNAYMLMFRQCDPQRNVYGLKQHEFPQHIQDLLRRIAEKKEEDRRNKEREEIMVSFRVHWNKNQHKSQDTRVFKDLDSTLDEVLADAHDRFGLNAIVPIGRCRLVHIDNRGGVQTILQSFEGSEKVPLQKAISSIVLKNSSKPLEMLLETREEGVEFEPILPGSIRTQVFVVDLYTEDVNDAVSVRTLPQHTVAQYREAISKKLRLNVDQMVVAAIKSNSCVALLIDDKITIEAADMVENSKVFVAMVGIDRTAEIEDRLLKIVERFEHVLTLYFVLPNTEKEILEKMSIPCYDDSQSRLTHSRVTNTMVRKTPSPLIEPDLSSTDVVDAALRSAPVYTFTLPNNRPASTVSSNQRPTTPSSQPIGTRFDLPESNSEDSSLSDGDRTLVEDQGSALARVDLSSTNNSPACSEAQLSSPESRIISDFPVDDDDDDDEDDDDDYDELPGRTKAAAPKPYFRAKLLDDEAAAAASSMSHNGGGMGSSSSNDFGPKIQQQRTLMVLADESMTLGQLKRDLEPFVCVPKKYFKIFRQSPPPETECARLTQQLREFKDGERLVIELGRTLRKGEHKYKVFHMKLADISLPGFEQLPQVTEFIVCNGAEVGQVKRAILADLAAIDPKYDISYDACRLRKKSYRTPSDIFTDDQRFGDDIQMAENRELILQELDESSMPYTNAEDKSLFVRRWNPATYTLSHLQEITVTMKEGTGTSELREIISHVSGIPVDRIEYMKKPAGSFMRHNMSVLKIHTEIGWESVPMFSDQDPLQYSSNGDMFFYRDKAEPLKELTPSEKREISNKENSANGTSSSMYPSSPRRERGLKIRIDPSPKKAGMLDTLN